MNVISNNACYIYIALWMVYYLQGMLPITGIIAQVILVVLLLISFYAFIQVNINYKTSSYIKWLNLMVLVLTIYGLIPILGGWSVEGSYIQMPWYNFIFLQRYYVSVLPIYAFYYFTLKRRLNLNNLKYLFIAIFLFSILYYYRLHFTLVSELELEEITNNASYVFLPLIPLLQLIKMKYLWKNLFLIIILAYIIMSMKRGAILTGGILTVLFLIYNYKTVSKKQLMYVVILSFTLLFFLYYFTILFYESSAYFQGRIRQTLTGDSSGRDYMYASYYDFFLHKTNGLEFIIGNGSNATWVLLGNYAHNDWLEFAINQGVIGVIMYIVYWALFVREWRYYQGPKECRHALGAIIVAYFLMTLFSMSFDGMVTATSLCIGYCLAMNEKAKITNLVEEVRNRILYGKNTSFD